MRRKYTLPTQFFWAVWEWCAFLLSRRRARELIRVYLRMLQSVERRGATEEALSLFDRAIQICPDNALVLYRRAKILIGLRRYEVRFAALD